MNTMNSQNAHLGWVRKYVLAPKDGKVAKTPNGQIDPRLFTGENSLQAVKDRETCLWTLKYERGKIPGALDQTFTSFKMATKFVEDYFKKRDVVIKEILD